MTPIAKTRTFLATASMLAVLTAGAVAQTTTPPAAPAPAAPATRAAAPADAGVYLSAQEVSVNKLIGMSIYAPKEGSAAATTTEPAPATTASTATSARRAIMPQAVSDEQWRTLRDRHDSIGKVDDLVIGADGRITHAIIGVGGFLGIGEKKVAVEISELRLMRSSDGTVFGVVTRTKQQLRDMPNFMGERS